jgi:hypothetical protein
MKKSKLLSLAWFLMLVFAVVVCVRDKFDGLVVLYVSLTLALIFLTRRWDSSSDG